MSCTETFDIALLDLHMPCQQNWESELALFISRHPQTQVCMITGIHQDSSMRKAFELGVKGYIHKTSGVNEVHQALSVIEQGGIYLPEKNRPPAHSDLVSNRQQEVLSLLAQGCSNKKIGTMLGVAESTVKRHLSNIFEALGVKSRLDAVRIARERGVIN